MSTKGFTLIEILVVSTMIGVLATIGVLSYTQFSKQARVTKRKADLDQLRFALEAYRTDHEDNYPTGSSFTWRDSCSLTNTGTNGYIPDLAPTYIPSLPHDPREKIANPGLNADCTAENVCYKYKSNGNDFKLVAYCGAELPVPFPTGDTYYNEQHIVDLQISTKNATAW